MSCSSCFGSGEVGLRFADGNKTSSSSCLVLFFIFSSVLLTDSEYLCLTIFRRLYLLSPTKKRTRSDYRTYIIINRLSAYLCSSNTHAHRVKLHLETFV